MGKIIIEFSNEDLDKNDENNKQLKEDVELMMEFTFPNFKVYGIKIEP